MTKRFLCHDTNLSEVSFSNNGRSLILFFLSMRDGHLEARLCCNSLISLKYNVAPSSSMPLYVGEVTHEIVAIENLNMRLKNLAYSFLDCSETSPFEEDGQLHFIHLEGGEIDIDIVCADVLFNNT